eukprot:gene46547-65404_t
MGVARVPSGCAATAVAVAAQSAGAAAVLLVTDGRPTNADVAGEADSSLSSAGITVPVVFASEWDESRLVRPVLSRDPHVSA